MIPEGWEKYKLEETVEVIIDYRGKTPVKSLTGIPLITAKIIKDGRINQPEEFIPEANYDNWMRRGIPQFGDVVMTTEAPLGEVAQINTHQKIALAQRIITLRGKYNSFDNGFLKYFLQSPLGQNNLKVKESGSTVTGIKQSELRDVTIYAPSFIDQKKIASILSSFDDKIEHNLQMNKTLEAIAQSIFKEWFVDFRFPEFDGELVNGLPKGWSKQELNTIIDIKHGYAFKGEFFTDNETENILLTPGNFKIGGGFNDAKFKYYFGEIPYEYILRRDDLIVTMTDLSKAGDTLGYPALVPAKPGQRFLHNQRLGKIMFKVDAHLKYYLYNILQRPEYRHYILGSATGSTVKHTSPTRILCYKAIIPDNSILDKFDKIAQSLYQKVQENSNQNRILAQIRDLLLPKLVTGKIRVA